MHYLNKTQKIKELREELSNTRVPMLSIEDHECITDRYQEALELGYYREELRDEIKAIKAMTYKMFDERYNPEPEVEENKLQYGDVICGDINEEEY